MNFIGESMKKLADSRLETILFKLTDNKFKSLLFGVGATALLQSSAAISAIIVSFVDSSIIKLKQASGIIIGAIFGTSVTGWIVVLSSIGNDNKNIFSVDLIVLILAVSGIILKIIIKKEKIKMIGDIMLGLVVLMVGLSMISSALEPIKSNNNLLEKLSSVDNLFLAFIIGIIISALLQSASAAVGLIQSISVIGAINTSFCVPFLLGVMIGSSLPVLIFAVGKRYKAKATSIIYLLVNVITSGTIGVIYIVLVKTKQIENLTLNVITISIINTVFRFIAIIICLPISGKIEKLSEKIVYRNTQKRSIISKT